MRKYNNYKRMSLLLMISIFVALSLGSCFPTVKTDTNDYQCIYENEIGYGEYKYNSYLLLFPRSQPTTINEFYYMKSPGLDVNFYSIYFSCTLEKSKYDSFVNGLDSLIIEYIDQGKSLLVNTDNFNYKAYIIQWCEPGEKWEVLEYILLDDLNNTIMFVYTMGGLDDIIKHTSYDVAPKNMFFLNDSNYVDYSIYRTSYDYKNHINPVIEFDEATYDISFLDYLM